MSEQDNKMNINSSGGRLNAGAAAFVPGNYDSKPAATSTTKVILKNIIFVKLFLISIYMYFLVLVDNPQWQWRFQGRTQSLWIWIPQQQS